MSLFFDWHFLPTWPPGFTPLIVFGLLLLMGSLGGYLANRVSWLPSIMGFMAVGFLSGPSGFGLLTEGAMDNARILIQIALALILYRLGLSLDIKVIWRSPGILFTAILEAALTFGLVFLVLYLSGIPLILTALVASISISSSPAVLLHVAHEVGAKGPVTESTKTLVALNNLISFMAFSAVLPAAYFSDGHGWATIIFQPLYRVFGSLLLGFIVAFVLQFIVMKTREASQYILALVIGSIMLAIGLATELKLSMLFVPLVVGAVVKSFEREKIVSKLTFGAPFELFFIVLFVFAGASLHIHELISFAPVVGALVLARIAAKVLGVMAMSPILKQPLRTGTSSGLLLLPMAGLAIGLVQTSDHLFPTQAPTISAIVLGAVTVFESIGPPIAAYAFRLSGEAGAAKGSSEDENGDLETASDANG